MVKRNFPPDLWHLDRMLCIFYGNRLIDGFKDPFQISDIIDKIVEYISKVHDRLPEIRSITGNRHDRSQRLISLPENDKAKQKNGSTDKHRNGINARPYKV